MTHRTSALTGLAIAAAVLSGAPPSIAAEAAVQTRPVRLEAVPGSTIRRIVLTDRAAKRLDIQTADVVADSTGGRIVPYAAIAYDLTGLTHVYTNPEALTYVRHAVVVRRINGTSAYLSEGPAVGTKVVTVGVPQLYGAEKGVGH